MQFHPTAIIAEGAQIGEGTTIGPYSIIGPNVVLGRNNKIGPHVVIEGYTTCGDENEVLQFASLGSKPQDLKYAGEKSTVIVGNKNSIREYVTIQPGTTGGGMVTKIGNGNLFMVSSHVGHDSLIGDDNVIANSCAIAGHVTIGKRIILGGLSAVHQFVQVGDYAMIGGGSIVVRDIVPCTISQGNHAVHSGINTIGLQRAGFGPETISTVKKAYRKFFIGKGPQAERLAAIREECGSEKLVQDIVAFIESSKRGMAAARSKDEE